MLDGVGEEIGVDEDIVRGDESGVVLEEERGLESQGLSIRIEET